MVCNNRCMNNKAEDCGADAGALVAFNEVLGPLNSMVTEARFT